MDFCALPIGLGEIFGERLEMFAECTGSGLWYCTHRPPIQHDGLWEARQVDQFSPRQKTRKKQAEKGLEHLTNKSHGKTQHKFKECDGKTAKINKQILNSFTSNIPTLSG